MVVLMPNIRYLAGRYWDYLDHHLPLTHLSLSEALELTGYYGGARWSRASCPTP